VCLLRRSHSDGLAWIDGAGAGSNMRREDKRAEEGGEEKWKRKRDREHGLRYTTFSAEESREGREEELHQDRCC
jgi:hypothetical protein